MFATIFCNIFLAVLFSIPTLWLLLFFANRLNSLMKRSAARDRSEAAIDELVLFYQGQSEAPAVVEPGKAVIQADGLVERLVKLISLRSKESGEPVSLLLATQVFPYADERLLAAVVSHL